MQSIGTPLSAGRGWLPHISPSGLGCRGLIERSIFGGHVWLTRVQRFAIGREVHVPDLGSIFIGCRGSGPGFGLRPDPWEVAMTTTQIVSDRELVPASEPLFTDGERAALAGFLAGYSGLTREA